MNYWCPVNFYPAYVLNSSVFKNKFLNDLASSALLGKAKASVVANIAYYAMSSSRGGM